MTRRELNDARYRGNSVYGYFNAYCFLCSSCDKCPCIIRTLCKIKDKIESLQTKIILHNCEEELEPCKVCGSTELKLRKVGDHKNLYIYECSNCGHKPSVNGRCSGNARSTTKEARKLWNTVNKCNER